MQNTLNNSKLCDVFCLGFVVWLGFFSSSDVGPGNCLIFLTVVIVTTQECSILRDLVFKHTA